MTETNGTETDSNDITNPVQSALASSIMSPVIGILVGQLILKVLNDLPFFIRQEKIEVIQKKLDRIKKRHNKSQFVMMKVKRSCKEYGIQQNKY